MSNPIVEKSMEYNDNRISLFVGQNGKCSVSKELLEIGNIECHHMKPKRLGGTDKYNNLTFVTNNVHKLIHATEEDIINKYKLLCNLDKENMEKLNELRKLVGNCVI